jgi:hypothetical protein
MSDRKTRRIKLTQSLGGTLQGPKGEERGTFVHLPGDEVEWDADEAGRLVKRGLATFVDGPSKR